MFCPAKREEGRGGTERQQRGVPGYEKHSADRFGGLAPSAVNPVMLPNTSTTSGGLAACKTRVLPRCTDNPFSSLFWLQIEKHIGHLDLPNRVSISQSLQVFATWVLFAFRSESPVEGLMRRCVRSQRPLSKTYKCELGKKEGI